MAKTLLSSFWGGARSEATRSALSSQPLEQDRRQIALGEGRDDHHHVLAGVLRPRADDDRRLQGRARRDADRHAFEPRDQARVGDGILVGDRDDLVIDRGVEDLRREAGADALDLVRAGLAARQHRRGLRLDGDDMKPRACAPSAPGRRR